MSPRALVATAGLFGLVPVVALATDGVPYDFVAGDRIHAQQVNENFDALLAEIERLDASLEELRTQNAELEARLERHESTSSWVDAALLNDWENYDAEFYTAAAYRKDSHGVVHLQGLVRNGSVGTIVMQLPECFRPRDELNFVAISAGTIGRVLVHRDGSVRVFEGDSGYVSFDGLSFLAKGC